MTDIEKIKAQAYIDIFNLRKAQEEGFITEFGKGELEALEGIVDFINSMQKEPVSKDLVEEIDSYIKKNGYDGLDSIEEVKYIANHFAKWQKEQMMAKAAD